MKKLSTKKALLFSALAMVLCVSMLVGTTFAWFTDTASTNVNKIQAGNLDVALEMYENGDWVSAEGKTLNFIKAEGHESEDILWEPGCIYELPELRVVNNGNLALKYKVVISGINGSAKLNEVIDWTIKVGENDFSADTEFHLTAKNTDNDSQTLTISGHMQETAGNEYQGLSIDSVSITVVATQDTVEYDSNNNTYDEYALKVFAYGDDVNNITLKSTVVDSNRVWNNLYEENGYSANGHKAIVFNQSSGDEATFTDCIFLCDVGNVYSVEQGTLTFKDCTFYGWVHFGGPTGATIKFENCTFKNSCDVKIGGSANSVTFDNCTFETKETIVDDTTTYSYSMECGRVMIWSDTTFNDCIILRDIAGDGEATLNNCVTVVAANKTIDEKEAVHGNGAYVGVTFDGKVELYNSNDDVVVFENCTFNDMFGSDYSAMIYGTAIFKDCIFNAGFHIDGATNGDLTIDNCVFGENSYIKIGGNASSVVFKNTTIVADTLTTPWGHQWIVTYSDTTFENCTLGRVVRAGAAITITLDNCVDADGNAVTADQVHSNATPTVVIK